MSETQTCQHRLTKALSAPEIQAELSRLTASGCRPQIACGAIPGGQGGKTTDDLTRSGGVTRPEIVLSHSMSAGLTQQQFNSLVAHELVHARYAHQEAQTGRRPHVGAEEVVAYASSGCCEPGGPNRLPAQSRCDCLRENSIRSCVDAGVPAEECRREVERALPGHGC